MRRIVSIVFLLVFLFNIAGYYPVFLIQQQLIRKEVRLAIQQKASIEELVCISVSKSDSKLLRWIKDDEFVYKGNLYDIVWMEKESDRAIHYWCINDDKEKSLLSHFEKEVNKNTDSNGSDPKGENNFIKNPLKDYVITQNIVKNHLSETSLFYFIENSNHSSPTINIITPPPKLS